ncbi:alcohol dehydrogenase [Salix viminalis]|uniref:Alcohol dehydrogenase n=1 Tax=Salix viminalis TaxID=40686 RepID=A0A9Q0UJH0_SALVM|nr:alcohol dehydrogenase [Salix viminalis]
MDGEKLSVEAGKPIVCKAAVAREAGEPLVMEEIMVAPPGHHEVRVRIICTTLCHSDVTFWKMKDYPSCFSKNIWSRGYRLSSNYGLTPACFHFLERVVESVGEDVDEVVEGDVVIPVFLPECGDCADCKSKKSNLCSKFPFEPTPWMPGDETSRFTDLKGEVLYHFLYVSSFSEYTVLNIANIVKIDPSIPPSRACLLSCGVSTGVGAAWKTANVEAGSTVAIFGLGSIGLAVAEGSRICGATKIIGVDVNQEKFELGKKFGITDFVNVGECGDKPVSQVINEMTGGGADFCFECVGLASLMEQAYASCRKGWGKTIILGVEKPGSQITFQCSDVVLGGRTLMGSLFGGLKAKSDIPILLKRYMDKELELDKFVTHEVSFEDINKAFDLLLEGKSIRCVIWMDK